MPNSHLAEAARHMAEWRKRKAKQAPRKVSIDPATKDHQDFVRRTGERLAWHVSYGTLVEDELAKNDLMRPEHRQPILNEAVKEARKLVERARQELRRREDALSRIEAVAKAAAFRDG